MNSMLLFLSLLFCYHAVRLQFTCVRIAMRPVAGVAALVQVLDRGGHVLPHPWVVGVLDVVLLADLTHLGRDEWVPCRTHAWEEMVLDLEVEAARQAAGDETAVRAGGLDLGLEPADRLAVRAGLVGWVAVGVLEVVGQGEEDGEGEGGGGAHDHDVSENVPRVSALVDGRSDAVGEDVEESQEDGVLAALLDVVRLHLETDVLRSALSEIEDLWVEDGAEPVCAKGEDIVECLEAVHEGTLAVAWLIVIEEDEWFGTEGIWVLLVVVGE
mmetsp:Transcript_19342/g.53807  ORF Transcript_19342/g.53807 Transcript_19342/m.53807 type:complete len:270 (+) Transcript_19342:667-1476(+)